MKRIITFMSSAMLLLTGLCTSCQKELDSLGDNGTAVNEVMVKATIAGSGTKVSFTEDGTENKLKAQWEESDHIVGRDAAGNAIELAVASLENGGKTAVFKTVSGSASIPSSGEVYMIYAPGKDKSYIENKSLTYELSDQGDGKVPALMTATGTVSGGVLNLTFTNRLAIVALKNPTFPVTKATTITGLKLSGSNILTKATFGMNGNALQMSSSVDGAVTRGCNFTTTADGKTETMVYFAVLPNNTQADVTISTTAPTGYRISFPGKSFEANKCYLLAGKTLNKQEFTVTVDQNIQHGTVSTSHSGSVAWGTQVTVNATPNTGFDLESITVTDANSNNVSVTKDGKFTMPQANVTVAVTFKASVPGEINGTEMEEGDNNW